MCDRHDLFALKLTIQETICLILFSANAFFAAGTKVPRVPGNWSSVRCFALLTT